MFEFSKTRKRDDFDSWIFLSNLTCCGDAIHAGHHQIHEHNVWSVKGSFLHRLGAIGSLTDQLHVFVDKKEF
jgi:hypothetical protein